MSVHSIKIVASKSISLDDAQMYVEAWIDNHEFRSNVGYSDLGVVNTKMDGSGTDYFQGRWRFDFQEDKASLLDEIDQTLANYVDWHKVEYHICDHDDPSGGCDSDTVERSNGTIPDGV